MKGKMYLVKSKYYLPVFSELNNILIIDHIIYNTREEKSKFKEKIYEKQKVKPEWETTIRHNGYVVIDFNSLNDEYLIDIIEK